MNETKKALDQALARLIIIASSSKAWFTVLGMAMTAYIGFRQGGLDGMLIALSGALGLPAIYTVAKTVQNVKLGNGSSKKAAALVPAAVNPAKAPGAAPATSSAAQPPPSPGSSINSTD